MRVTVLLSILSNGIMLPPLFIFKRQKELPSELRDKYAKDCLIYSNTSGWITEEILCDWFQKVWLNLNIASNIKPVLIFDKCKVHISGQVKDFLKERDLLYEVLPAGTTGYLQPLDVSINKPIKDAMKEKFNKWFQEEGIKATNRTPSGYLRAPSYECIIKWTLEACNSIKSDVISHSFKTTGKYSNFFLFLTYLGISLESDGSENHLFNHKVQETEQLKTNINEIISKKKSTIHMMMHKF